MTLPDYRLLRPFDDETAVQYAQRLERDGHEEMFIRMALRTHFQMEIREFAVFFEDFPKARLRHLAKLYDRAPNRTDYAFARKVAGNLGIDQDRANYWVKLFREAR